MLKLNNISKYYYSGNNIVMALSKIDLEFKSGEFVAITGESGSGKSTLLNVISGLDTYEDGTMFVNEHDISHYTVSELETYRKQYIGFVFQDYNIIDSYTVLENVEMALIIQGFDKKERRARAKELIEQVGLSKQMKQKASLLSGGEKQRTVIARALAKDCPILVCDEPTGNLDTEASKNVLQLLHDISEQKLVIIVTHNYEDVKDFATRKVRLYDGEIIEDTIITKDKKLQDSFEEIKPYNTKKSDVLMISLRNLFSVPKKTFFTMLIILFMVFVFIYGYGSTLQASNVPINDTTDFFANANKSRVIVTKRDNASFTESELLEINKIQYVRDIVDHDIVFDTVLINSWINTETGDQEFTKYKILASASLNDFDLLEGRLPTKEFEAVIGDSSGFLIGDYVGFSNEEEIKKVEGAITNTFIYKIVGIINESVNIEDKLHDVYLHSDAFDSIKYSSIYEFGQVYLNVDMVRSYSLVTDVRIDNTLEDNVFLGYDMMFFDMCRDFGYKEEVVDDFDAGLCPRDWWLPNHDFYVSAITRFESIEDPIEIILESVEMYPHIYGQGMYVNEATFKMLFDDDVYQPAVVVYDMFEAKQVKTELEEMGYNVFYPAGIISEEDALLVIVRNVQLTLTLGLIIVVTYFVGYLVLRNVIGSKKKDYLIYRSIGASKLVINSMLILEIIYITIFSFTLVLIGLSINENMKSVIPKLLRYFKFGNYVFIFLVFVVIMLIMANSFNKRLFTKSVISSLRAE